MRRSGVRFSARALRAASVGPVRVRTRPDARRIGSGASARTQTWAGALHAGGRGAPGSIQRTTMRRKWLIRFSGGHDVRVQMFVENPAGSRVKHLYDEERLVQVGQRDVAVPYPFTYGFVPGVPAPDGDCLDCFLLDPVDVEPGDLVVVEVVGVLDQVEDSGHGRRTEDHNLLARRAGDVRGLSSSELEILTDFIGAVFGDDGPRMLVGPAHGVDRAALLLDRYRSTGE